MIKKKLTVVAAMVAAAALALTGCSGSSAGTSGSATSGNLTVYWQPDYKPNMDWLIKQFEAKYPKAHVKVTYVNQSQYFSLIRTQLTAGTAPDVFWATPGNGNPFAMEVLAKAGYLADMSSAPWAKSLVPSIAQYSKYDGKTYDLQTNVSAYGVLYNDTALAKEGLTAPQNWDQVLTFCKAAKNKGVQAYAMGAQDLFFTQQFIFSSIPTLVYKKDPKTDAEMASKSITFATSPGWQETMDKYKQAQNAGCFGNSPAGTSFNTAVNNVASGSSLGVIGAYLFSSAITAVNPQAKLTFGAFPVASDPHIMVGAFGGAGVNAKAKDLPLAKTFVNFLGQPKIMSGYSNQGTGSLSTITGGSGAPASNAGLQTIQKFLDEGKTSGFVDQTWPNADIQQAMYQSTQSMLTGGTTPEGVLKAMAAKW